jgi:hypothetical protein
MKRIVVLIVMGLFSISMSFAESDPELIEEISEKVQIDLSAITLDQYEQDFVKVEFKIYDGLIQIVNIKASQPELKKLIISELKEIHVKNPYSESEVYNFNFTFKKK